MDSQPNIASLCGITTVRATDAQRNATCTAPDEERASRCDLTSWYASLERDAIIALAHRYWRERGCPEGSAEEDWFRAEREIAHECEPYGVLSFGDPEDRPAPVG